MRKRAVLRSAQLKLRGAAMAPGGRTTKAGGLALSLVGTGSYCEHADAGRVV